MYWWRLPQRCIHKNVPAETLGLANGAKLRYCSSPLGEEGFIQSPEANAVSS